MKHIAIYILQYPGLYWIIAVFMSIFWGYFGVKYEELDEVEEVIVNQSERRNITLTNTKIKIKKQPQWYQVGTFLSDGMLSLVGWICLYVLLKNISDEKLHDYENFNIFLGTVAVICITGYGYKIAEKLKQ
jgi:hypothetical protein